MTPGFVVEIGRETILTCILVVGPIMAIGFIIGMSVSFIQALFQIQEMTLAFVPKLLAMGFGLIFFGNWMIQKLMTYTTHLLGNFKIVSG